MFEEFDSFETDEEVEALLNEFGLSEDLEDDGEFDE